MNQIRIAKSEDAIECSLSRLSNSLLKLLGSTYPCPMAKDELIEKLYGIKLRGKSDRYRLAMNTAFNKLMSRTRRRIEDITVGDHQIQIICVNRGSRTGYKLIRFKDAQNTLDLLELRPSKLLS
jgi:hypothetical protein